MVFIYLFFTLAFMYTILIIFFFFHQSINFSVIVILSILNLKKYIYKNKNYALL